MGWGLGDLSASLLGYDKPDDVNYQPTTYAGQFKDVLLSQLFFPQIAQFMNMATLTGQSSMGFDMLAKLFPAGGGTPKSSDLFNISKEMAAMLPQLQEQASQAQAANFQKTYDTFSKIPALSDIFSKAGGNVDSTGALANIFGNLSGAALGSAASSGFLTDPVKQNNVLGPLALQKYQIEQDIQQQAQAQALGLVGAGALPQTGMFGSSASLFSGASPYIAGGLNAANLFGGLNSQMGLQAQMANQSAFNSYQQAGLAAQMQGFSTMFGSMGGG